MEHGFKKCVRRQRAGTDPTKYHTWPKTPHGKVTKHKKNTTCKSARRLALFQVTTRLQWTDNKAWHTRNMNNKIYPQKKHYLGTVSKNTGGLKLVSWNQPHPYYRFGLSQIDVSFAWKISLHVLIEVTSPIKHVKYKLRYKTEIKQR